MTIDKLFPGQRSASSPGRRVRPPKTDCRDVSGDGIHVSAAAGQQRGGDRRSKTGLRFMNDLATYEIFWHFLYLAVFHGVRSADDGTFEGRAGHAGIVRSLRKGRARRSDSSPSWESCEDARGVVLQVLRRQVSRRRQTAGSCRETVAQIRLASPAEPGRADGRSARPSSRRSSAITGSVAQLNRQAATRRNPGSRAPGAQGARLRLRRVRVRRTGGGQGRHV